MLRPWWPKGFSCVSHELVTANTANECLDPGLPRFCLVQKVYFTDNIAFIKKKLAPFKTADSPSDINSVSSTARYATDTNANVDKNKIPTQTWVRCSAVFSSLHFLPIFLTFTAEVKLPKSLCLQNN